MSRILLSIVLTGFFLSACKKEIDFSPPQVEDFTGKYFVSGIVETTVPTKTSTPFAMSTGRDSASGSTCELVANYSSQQGHRLTSSLLREDLRLRQFEPLFFGGASNLNTPINQWTLAELDSIFQVGKKLPFGTDFGEVEMEFADVLSTPTGRLYESAEANNTGNFVLIEAVEDVRDKFDGTSLASPWVKVVTFSFRCHLRVGGEPTYDAIEMKDCRATMLFKPYVK